MLKSSIRKTQVLRGGDYAREDAEDEGFNDYFGSLQSIVTSSAQNDSGLFETNLHDERYLPFENSGVISEWQLELPADVRQFDYDTISDVILHLSYTAREGGGLLKNGAVSNLKTKIKDAQASGSVRLFSVRHEFPTEWAKFKSIEIEGETKTSSLVLELRQEHFPFWSHDRVKAVKRVDFFAKGKGLEITENADGTGEKDTFIQDESFGDLWWGQLTHIPPINQSALLSIEFNVNFTDNSMEDLWLALTWGKSD